MYDYLIYEVVRRGTARECLQAEQFGFDTLKEKLKIKGLLVNDRSS